MDIRKQGWHRLAMDLQTVDRLRVGEQYEPPNKAVRQLALEKQEKRLRAAIFALEVNGVDVTTVSAKEVDRLLADG